MDTGVRSRQTKGTPVANGVVNRLDSVMMILWGLPLSLFTSRNPSAPAPPDLFTTMMGCEVSLFLAATPWIKRAIWSAPPPVPAGTTNSMGLVGSHAKAGAIAAASASATAPWAARTMDVSFMQSPSWLKIDSISGERANPACSLRPDLEPARSPLPPSFCHLQRAASRSRSARFAMSQKSTPHRSG